MLRLLVQSYSDWRYLISLAEADKASYPPLLVKAYGILVVNALQIWGPVQFYFTSKSMDRTREEVRGVQLEVRPKSSRI